MWQALPQMKIIRVYCQGRVSPIQGRRWKSGREEGRMEKRERKKRREIVSLRAG